MNMKKSAELKNLRLAKLRWGRELNRSALEQLRNLSKEFRFAVASGDLLLLGASWYITNTGLLRLAARRRCRGIQVQPITEFSDPVHARYIFKATVLKSEAQEFVGYGDADPSNFSMAPRCASLRLGL